MTRKTNQMDLDNMGSNKDQMKTKRLNALGHVDVIISIFLNSEDD